MLKIKILKESKNYPSLKTRTQQFNIDFLLQNDYINTDIFSDKTIITNFIEDLGNQKFEMTGDPDTFDTIDQDINPVTLIEELVKNIPSLRNNKITKAITGTSFGKIFKLSNEHILKIFLGGVDVEEDIRWFSKCYDMMHSGEAKPTTLPVYRWKWQDGFLPSYPEFKVGFVEMAEFEPLDKFLKKSGRGEADDALKQIHAVFLKAFSEGHKTKDDVMDYIYNFIGIDKVESAINHLFYYLDLDKKTITSGKTDDYIKFIFDYLDIDKSKYSSDIGNNIDIIYKKLKLDARSMHFSPKENPFNPLTVSETEKIIQSFCDMLEMGFKLSDVAPRNLARLIQSDPADPIIVIFDR